MCPKLCLSPLHDETDECESRPPRPALGGGSDRRPPSDDDPPDGNVIPFPLTRVQPPPASPDHPSSEQDQLDPAAGSPPSDGALWAAWLSGVLHGSRPVEVARG
jgi:hypothetical protein